MTGPTPVPDLPPVNVVINPNPYKTSIGIRKAVLHFFYAAFPVAIAYLIGVLPDLVHNPKLLVFLPMTSAALKFILNYWNNSAPKIEDILTEDPTDLPR